LFFFSQRKKGRDSFAPADIRYPTDWNLLNEAREKTEKIIDFLHKECTQGGRKPRTYR